ncbi:MAG: adenylyltransferase/cytidyltransferase family protein [Elusimicrobia bacterium]|nr:adenylyltransferase/cytidyltransferase family protein [Elusimicrobiota bacterium]
MTVSVTIGVYDGVHLGHRKVLRKFFRSAGKKIVFLFFRNPRKGFGVLTDLAERKKLILSLGEAEVAALPFEKFKNVPAEKFFTDFLVKKYRVYRIVVGEDFRFGREARGDVRLLRNLCRREGINLQVVGEELFGGRKISTSRIKKFLLRGDVETAGKLLGRFYSVSGEKVKGRGISGTLGFPTINLLRKKNRIYPEGVFLTRVFCSAGEFYAVANVGQSPTFGLKRVFEFYALEPFPKKVLNCRKFKVFFLEFIRKAKKYKTRGGLIKRIKKDVEIAKKNVFRFAKFRHIW